MIKPTKEQILQALDDLEEGKPITAELRHAVNLFQKAEVEAHLDATASREVAAERGLEVQIAQLRKESLELIRKAREGGITIREQERLNQLWMFTPKDGDSY